MTENAVAPETTNGPCPTACGGYGPIQVEMHDTIGVIALVIVSVLLLRMLLKQQTRNRALTERLVLQHGRQAE
jgi:Ni/Fe-hydrogenase subunit HybB-like protein